MKNVLIISASPRKGGNSDTLFKYRRKSYKSHKIIKNPVEENRIFYN